MSRTISIVLLTLLALLRGPSMATAQESQAAAYSAEAGDGRHASQLLLDLRDPSVLELLDSAFSAAVDGMAAVLFYPVGAHEQIYVVYTHQQHYVRDRDSDGPFHRLDDMDGGQSESLSPADIQALGAQGKLVLGPDGEYVRQGRLGSRAVDFVTVALDEGKLQYGSKFVLDRSDGTFHKVLKKRELLSPDESLSHQEVERLARQGRLKQDEEKLQAGAEKPYLLAERKGGAPVVVVWLALGGIFFTFYLRGFNFWGFKHAVEVVRGRFDNPNDTGEVTHFQALSSALSATVGLGNIAGVTIAMTMGGPGAFFWMILCGLFGMMSKFTECTLGQIYRKVNPDGTVLGGPMRYLRVGLAERRLGALGVLLSMVFAVMCILASFGGGNMFQANQSGGAVLAQLQKADYERLNELDRASRRAAEERDLARLTDLKAARADVEHEIEVFERVFLPVYGVILAILVAVVIIGGIRRIGAATEKIVPSMCLIYIAACLWIILSHVDRVPYLIAAIFTEAFTGEAMGGGLVGVLVVGVRRAAFSNEAGIGSAAIAHSAARTEEPVREGSVAMLGPFIDTIIVCSMTALVILITGAWDRSDWIVDEGLQGAQLTSRAFGNEISWFPWILSVAVVLFAYSTIISWSYYGERAWESLFGRRSTIVYKFMAVTCVFIGAVVNLGAVLDFSDMMILSMAFPNILGLLFLAPRVKRDMLDYWRRYRADAFPRFK